MFSRSSKQSDSIASSNSNDLNSRFSLNELKRIHQQLIENKHVDENNKILVVEILRVIAEMVVYGDNKSELLFDFFCEKNMLSLFLEIMWTEGVCPIQVHVQILQTLSILISSVKNDTSLYYLLSNNHINDIINFPHDFSQDEMLAAQFASFIKTMSLRLNEQTVQFFFIEETGGFPLLTKSIELLGINDPMIRISAQTAILNVYNVRDSRARSYALQDQVLLVLFEAISQLMKNQLLQLQNLSMSCLKHGLDSDSSVLKTEQTTEDLTIVIEDWLYYLQDLFDLNIEVLQKSLFVHLLNAFIIPELITPSKAFITYRAGISRCFTNWTYLSDSLLL
jgi:protein CLEC16A